MEIVLLKKLSKMFTGGDKPALNEVSFSVRKGELLSLLGESGSGKTTLLRLLAGFEIPTSGEVALNGRTVVSDRFFVPPEQRGVGMVFQGCALFPHLTIAANIGFGLHRRDKSQRRRRVEELLELIGLRSHGTRYPHELSGGEQQRVALARALAPEPNLILLDEPFSNLDETLKDQMRTEVKSILSQTGSTAILVTHDTEDALAISQRIAILRHGEIQQIDSPEAIYSRPANPYVANLFGKTNIIKATDLTVDGDGSVTVVDTDGHSVDSSLLSIRPEDFTVVEECQGSICASVKEIVFHGRYKSLMLMTTRPGKDNYYFTVFVDPDHQVKVNDRIHVRPMKEKIHVIPK